MTAALGVPGMACKAKPAVATILVLLAAGLASACSTSPVAPVDPAQVMQKFGFLRDGATTRQEVVDRMGAPHATYEKNSMVTYVVFGNELGNFNVGIPPSRGSSRGEYTLVLVFDARDVLNKHSLVFKK